MVTLRLVPGPMDSESTFARKISLLEIMEEMESRAFPVFWMVRSRVIVALVGVLVKFRLELALILGWMLPKVAPASSTWRLEEMGSLL